MENEEKESSVVEGDVNNKPVDDGMDIFASFSAPTKDTAEGEVVTETAVPEESAEPVTPRRTTESFDLDAFEAAGRKSAERKAAKLARQKAKKAGKAEGEAVEEYVESPVRRIAVYLFNLLLTVGCVAVIVVCAVATLMALYVVKVTADDGDLIGENKLKLGYTTILYAVDSQTGEYVETQRLFGSSNRVWIDYDEIPEHMIEAVIAIEDQHFNTHHGVDWVRTFAAFFNEFVYDIFPTSQGGSTITQQLIKNITSDMATDRVSGALRKLREIYRAMIVENNHSKEEIMEAYLNTMSLSGRIAGVEAGANTYFCTTASELSLAQSCAVICVTNAPTAYNPLTNPDANRKRVTYILSVMYDQGKLDYDQWQAARNEALTMPYANTVDENGEYIIPRMTTGTSSVYSYFTDMIINDVLNDLVTYNGMTRSQASSLFWNNGLRVYTTMDTAIQARLEEMAIQDYWPTDLNKNGQRLQGAYMILGMDGSIKGVVGGIGEKTISRGLNRATDTTRQIGSAMKPIGVYGPALEADKINYSSTYLDQPLKLVINDELQTYPVNFSRTYSNAPCTVQRAVAQSINTVAVRVLQQITFNYSYQFLYVRLGVESLWGDYDRNYSSLALGGLFHGAKLVELAGAYIPAMNGGTYYEPYGYTKITDAEGHVLLDKTRSITVVRAYSSDTATVLNKLLQGVFTRAYGGTLYNLDRCGSLPLSGKSGTSNDNNDYITVGATPYYLFVGRLGYDINFGLKDAQKSNNRYTWNFVMPTINEGLEYKNFPVDSTVVALSFCQHSGLLLTDECQYSRTGYYKADQIPDYCVHSRYAYFSAEEVIVEPEEGEVIEG